MRILERNRLILILLTILFLMIRPQPVSGEHAHEQILGPGSLLQIKMTAPDGLNETFAVRLNERGLIFHPLLGSVSLTHLEATKAETFLEAILEQKGHSHALVKIAVTTLVRGGRAFVSGEVFRPGAYELQRPTALRDVILMAGGITPKGNSSRIRVTRKGTTRKLLKLSSRGDFEIKPGDSIEVLGKP